MTRRFRLHGDLTMGTACIDAFVTLRGSMLVDDLADAKRTGTLRVDTYVTRGESRQLICDLSRSALLGDLHGTLASEVDGASPREQAVFEGRFRSSLVDGAGELRRMIPSTRGDVDKIGSEFTLRDSETALDALAVEGSSYLDNVDSGDHPYVLAAAVTLGAEIDLDEDSSWSEDEWLIRWARALSGQALTGVEFNWRSDNGALRDALLTRADLGRGVLEACLRHTVVRVRGDSTPRSAAALRVAIEHPAMNPRMAGDAARQLAGTGLGGAGEHVGALVAAMEPDSVAGLEAWIAATYPEAVTGCEAGAVEMFKALADGFEGDAGELAELTATVLQHRA